MSRLKTCALVLAALACVLPALPKDQPVAELTGVVTSDVEGRMGGVLVTARPQGANMTVTVISDDQGRYAFPPGKLQPGKYTLTIRAVGYELAGQTAAEIKPSGAAHADIKLVKTKDLASQLTGAEWMMSIPGNEKQKIALFHCDQCHSLDHVAKSTYDAEGWMTTLHRMQNQWQAGSTFTHPMPPAFPSKEYPSDPELAKYSPGMFLVMKVIEQFCERKTKDDMPRLIDFGFGDAQYKAVLGNRQWRESPVYIFSRTWKGMAVNLIRTPTVFANETATRLLAKANLLQRVKKVWRNRAANAKAVSA